MASSRGQRARCDLVNEATVELFIAGAEEGIEALTSTVTTCKDVLRLVWLRSTGEWNTAPTNLDRSLADNLVDALNKGTTPSSFRLEENEDVSSCLHRLRVLGQLFGLPAPGVRIATTSENWSVKKQKIREERIKSEPQQLVEEVLQDLFTREKTREQRERIRVTQI